MVYIKEKEGYYFEKKKLYSKYGNEIRLTVKGYTKGYWINRKFVTLNKLKQLTFVKSDCPF